MAILQNSMDLLEAEPGSCSERCVTSYDENDFVDVKIEADPVLLTHPPIKCEHEVSFVCVHY
jgi:hypothetical protein